MSSLAVVPPQAALPEESPIPVFEQLTDEDRAGIERLVTSILKEDQSARRAEVRWAWKQRSMKNGNAYTYYNSTTYMLCTPGEAGSDGMPTYMDNYDIFTPHGKSIVSLFTQSPVGIDFVPNSLQRSMDVSSAAVAEKLRFDVDRMVSMRDVQAEAAWNFCTDGRTVLRTYIDREGQLQVKCYGVLESKVPIYIRQFKNWGYCAISEEIDKYQAKDDYPDFADKIEGNDSDGTNVYERYARLNILADKRGGGSGESLKNLVTHHEVWVRPSRYRKAKDGLEDTLGELFPDGARFTLMGTVLVDAIPQKMDEELSVDYPIPGHGSARPSLLRSLVPIQEAYNDIKNMCRENADYGIGALWVDGSNADSEAIAEQRSEPGVVHPMTPAQGSTVAQSFFQETPSELSQQTVQMLDALLADGQNTTGDVPSLMGLGTPDSETYSGQKLLTDNAKGQFSAPWGAMQRMFARTYRQAVMLVGQMQGESTITDGQWDCYPDTDSSFPETTADKRAALQTVLSQLGNADGGAAIAMQPDNLKLIKQYSGLTDLVIPGAEARDKQLREIDQLLQEVPVPDQDPAKIQAWQQASQQAQAQGQPPPPQPMTSSIPVGKRDYHQPELDKCQEWLSSSACYEEQLKGNQQGIQNVELHADLHEAALAAAAPAPQFKPPNISITATVTEPSAIAQILARDGITADPGAIAASQVPEAQEMAANTQHKAAQAQHVSVLAAKEAVEPAGGFRTVVKPTVNVTEKPNG